MAVIVLEALARQSRTAGRRAHQEAAAAGIAERPDLIARALEPEHRVEYVKRDRGQAVRGIRGAGCLERGHRACLRDALFEYLAVLRLAVAQNEL